MTTIGISGSQHGGTAAQLEKAVGLALSVADPQEEAEVHHGMCRGVDTQMHFLLRARLPNARIHGWPGVNKSGQSPTRGMADHFVDVLHGEMPYLDRDREIVRAVETLIALPRTHVEQNRSGTWFTVRRARDRGIEIFIVFPDGMVQEERHGAVMVW